MRVIRWNSLRIHDISSTIGTNIWKILKASQEQCKKQTHRENRLHTPIPQLHDPPLSIRQPMQQQAKAKGAADTRQTNTQWKGSFKQQLKRCFWKRLSWRNCIRQGNSNLLRRGKTERMDPQFSKTSTVWFRSDGEVTNNDCEQPRTKKRGFEWMKTKEKEILAIIIPTCWLQACF